MNANTTPTALGQKIDDDTFFISIYKLLKKGKRSDSISFKQEMLKRKHYKIVISFQADKPCQFSGGAYYKFTPDENNNTIYDNISDNLIQRICDVTENGKYRTYNSWVMDIMKEFKPDIEQQIKQLKPSRKPAKALLAA